MNIMKLIYFMGAFLVCAGTGAIANETANDSFQLSVTIEDPKGHLLYTSQPLIIAKVKTFKSNIDQVFDIARQLKQLPKIGDVKMKVSYQKKGEYSLDIFNPYLRIRNTYSPDRREIQPNSYFFYNLAKIIAETANSQPFTWSYSKGTDYHGYTKILEWHYADNDDYPYIPGSFVVDNVTMPEIAL